MSYFLCADVTGPLLNRGGASKVLITGPAVCAMALLVVLVIHVLTKYDNYINYTKSVSINIHSQGATLSNHPYDQLLLCCVPHVHYVYFIFQ